MNADSIFLCYKTAEDQCSTDFKGDRTEISYPDQTDVFPKVFELASDYGCSFDDATKTGVASEAKLSPQQKICVGKALIATFAKDYDLTKIPVDQLAKSAATLSQNEFEDQCMSVLTNKKSQAELNKESVGDIISSLTEFLKGSVLSAPKGDTRPLFAKSSDAQSKRAVSTTPGDSSPAGASGAATAQ